jgi:hypothetical protein
MLVRQSQGKPMRSRPINRELVAQEQLIQTPRDAVSSSLKVCQLSLLLGLRIFNQICNAKERVKPASMRGCQAPGFVQRAAANPARSGRKQR